MRRFLETLCWIIAITVLSMGVAMAATMWDWRGFAGLVLIFCAIALMVALKEWRNEEC